MVYDCTMSTSSTAQQARQDIADRLREIRLDAGLTARAVAAAAGWHESKCSRIEHARTPPSDDDIRAWCRACGASDQAADLIAASRAAESTWTQWRRLERPGMRRAQEAVAPLWERTRRFRIYSQVEKQTRELAVAIGDSEAEVQRSLLRQDAQMFGLAAAANLVEAREQLLKMGFSQ